MCADVAPRRDGYPMHMHVTDLVIAIWQVIGLAVVWSDPKAHRGERVTPEEAGTYNALRGL